MAYRQALDSAKTIDELLPWMAEKNRKQVAETPAGDRAQMFAMMRPLGTITDLEVVRENKKTTGKVTIVKEGGAWKVGNESWFS